jgi:hypothetical protein
MEGLRQHMGERQEYRLKIDAYTRETMPMKRLAEYLADMAILMGEEGSVHLLAIESGSTCPVIMVDWEAEPKVLDRITKVRETAGPEDAQRASQSIDCRLRQDNASADLISPARGKLMEFPGAKSPQPVEWPSIHQAGDLIGIPIAVGGKNELVPVHLQDGETEYHLLAKRDKAKRIAEHLFTTTVRVSGQGRWRKAPAGPWILERFLIDDFEPIQITELGEAVQQLRDIEGNWKLLDDPLAELEEIRSGPVK